MSCPGSWVPDCAGLAAVPKAAFCGGRVHYGEGLLAPLSLPQKIHFPPPTILYAELGAVGPGAELLGIHSQACF